MLKLECREVYFGYLKPTVLQDEYFNQAFCRAKVIRIFLKLYLPRYERGTSAIPTIA